MRGGASIGGRAFRPPTNTPRRGVDPLDVLDNLPAFEELETAPILEPVNDEWSISDPFEAVDPRDCAKYPASPYCEDDLIRFGAPIGFDIEVRSNNCTTCVYIYPVVAFIRLTPTVICKRDPNCQEDGGGEDNGGFRGFGRPPRLNENVQPDPYKSAACARRESVINRFFNWFNDESQIAIMERITPTQSEFGATQTRNITFKTEKSITKFTFFSLTEEENNSGCFDDLSRPFPVPDENGNNIIGASIFGKFGDTYLRSEVIVEGEERFINENGVPTRWSKFIYSKPFVVPEYAPCCGFGKKPTVKPPPPPPPPFGQDDSRQGKRKGGKGGCGCMCCNSCNDSKENTDQLLREIREIRKALGSGKLQKALNAAVGIGDDSVTGILNKLSRRIGLDAYPIEVPEALLQGQGDKVVKLQSNAEFLYWIVTQMDGLIGQFPIDIEVKDIDPLKAGDQKKTITLPNIAEAIAELYGLTIKSSVNQEVELNMLLRLAAETIATKNAAVVTQDYARANANFLGYKGNFKPRELQYNFDFSGANLDPKAKQPIVLENLLKTVTGYVQGWQLEDKETVVGFLQKLMFSAGIIKAVFFRGKGNQKELNRELNSMAGDDKAQQARYEAFIKEINDPNSKYNKESGDKPEIKDETPPDKKGAK